MSEEEIEAVEWLKKVINYYKKDIEECGKGLLREETLEKYETILNIIEKQKKQINKLKESNKDILRKLRNRVKEVKKLSKYSLYKKEFKRLNGHIAEKDKTIEKQTEKERNLKKVLMEQDELIEKLSRELNEKNKRKIYIRRAKNEIQSRR